MNTNDKKTEALSYSTRLFRKRPVIVEAKQWFKDGDHPEVQHVCEGKYFVHTLEGDMLVHPGNWIVTGVRGEFYPVRDDVFSATYEEVH